MNMNVDEGNGRYFFCSADIRYLCLMKGFHFSLVNYLFGRILEGSMGVMVVLRD